MTAAALQVSGFDEQDAVAVDVGRWVHLAQLVLREERVDPDAELGLIFVDEGTITDLNLQFLDGDGPTDVLAFPIDGAAHLAGDAAPGVPPEGRQEATDRVRGAQASDSPPRELGDVVICPARTIDLREAVVHGVLHLVGMDHETDEGEMLALQAQLLAADARR